MKEVISKLKAGKCHIKKKIFFKVEDKAGWLSGEVLGLEVKSLAMSVGAARERIPRTEEPRQRP